MTAQEAIDLKNELSHDFNDHQVLLIFKNLIKETDKKILLSQSFKEKEILKKERFVLFCVMNGIERKINPPEREIVFKAKKRQIVFDGFVA